MPLASYKESAGWLAPDGLFYPCENAGHDRLATELAFEIYNSTGGTQTLEKNNWVRISRFGTITCENFFFRLNDLQKGAIENLANMSTGVYQKNMLDILDFGF